jgi:hypothetical protein
MLNTLATGSFMDKANSAKNVTCAKTEQGKSASERAGYMEGSFNNAKLSAADRKDVINHRAAMMSSALQRAISR